MLALGNASIPQKGDKIPYIWCIDCQKVEVQYI